MKYRFFLALVWGLFLTYSGTGQGMVSLAPEEAVLANPYGTIGGNPSPGLGYVSPGSLNPSTSLPPSIMLYAEDTNYSELSPTAKSTELYLSRFPSGKRTGMFQKINFNTLWAPNSGSQGLGMTELDLSAMFALPMPTPDSPLLLTPKFATTFFDGDGWDETFYTTGLGMRWIRPVVKDKFTLDFGFSVYYSGDFRVRAGEALRFPAHIAGTWQFNPRTKIVLGVVYSDRKDSYNWFPMAGLIWTPNDDVSVELLVPRLRIAQRVRWFDSTADAEPSDWLYSAFEFGSGSWGYEPLDGRIEYRDLRLLWGYERRTRFGATLGLEVGYMFNRDMGVDRFGSWYPSDSVFLRVRSSF
jgi:hypothetical protein